MSPSGLQNFEICFLVGLDLKTNEHCDSMPSVEARASILIHVSAVTGLFGPNREHQTIDASHQMFFAMQGKDSAVKQSGIWLGMLEAVCLRACGNATPTIEQMTQMPPTDPVRTCATSLVNILVRLAEAYETLETPDLAESALRQALEVCSFCNRLLGS